MRIIVEGKQGEGKTKFVHGVLIDALRRAGRGARFYFEGDLSPSLLLSGPDVIDVIERQTDA